MKNTQKKQEVEGLYYRGYNRVSVVVFMGSVHRHFLKKYFINIIIVFPSLDCFRANAIFPGFRLNIFGNSFCINICGMNT